MGDHDLLIEHAGRWAAQKRRALDADLLELALEQFGSEIGITLDNSESVDEAMTADQLADLCLIAALDDCGVWTRRKGHLVGSPFGWDVALSITKLVDAGDWPEDDPVP